MEKETFVLRTRVRLRGTRVKKGPRAGGRKREEEDNGPSTSVI